MKVLGWIRTAVVEHISKEGISDAEYRIALIYYNFKPYLKYALFLSMICNFFFCHLNAVLSIPYLYALSVLQRISW